MRRVWGIIWVAILVLAMLIPALLFLLCAMRVMIRTGH